MIQTKKKYKIEKNIKFNKQINIISRLKKWIEEGGFRRF